MDLGKLVGLSAYQLVMGLLRREDLEGRVEIIGLRLPLQAVNLSTRQRTIQQHDRPYRCSYGGNAEQKNDAECDDDSADRERDGGESDCGWPIANVDAIDPKHGRHEP
jgi:hypothetical protein